VLPATSETLPALPGLQPPNVFTARPGTPAAAPRQAPYTLVWSREIEEAGMRSLTISARALITAGGPAPLEARSLADGGTLWTADTETDGAFAIDGATLVAIAGSRVLGIAADSGQTLWTRDMNSGPLLGPDARDGVAVVSTGKFVYALHVSDGTPAWQTDLGAPVSLAPVLSDRHVAVSLADKSVVVIDRRTGAVVWKAPMDFAPVTLAIAGERVVVTTDDYLCMFRMPGTRHDWCFEVGIPAAGAAVLDDQNIYVPYLDNTLHVFRMNGAMRASPALTASPARFRTRLAGGLVMIPLVTGTVVFIRPSEQFAVLKLTSPDEGLFPVLRGWSASDDGIHVALFTVSPSGYKLTLLRRTDAPPGPATEPAKGAAPPVPATAP